MLSTLPRYDAVISIGAIDVMNFVADFSDSNDKVDITAPGVNVLSTSLAEAGYSVYSGTSMASAHVAGVPLLLWNKRRHCSNKIICQALQQGAKDRGIEGRDDSYGHGIVNYHDANNMAFQLCPTSHAKLTLDLSTCN